MKDVKMKEDRKGIIVQGRHLIKSFRSVVLRYINETGQTVGFETILIPKKAKNLNYFIKPFIKKWNQSCHSSLIAVDAVEFIETENKPDQIKAVQLTFF